MLLYWMQPGADFRAGSLAPDPRPSRARRTVQLRFPEQTGKRWNDLQSRTGKLALATFLASKIRIIISLLQSLDFCHNNHQAPDALNKIEIVGIEKIELADLEDAIAEHGSVLACMDNRDTSCPGYYRRKSQIVNGEKDLHIYEVSCTLNKNCALLTRTASMVTIWVCDVTIGTPVVL